MKIAIIAWELTSTWMAIMSTEEDRLIFVLNHTALFVSVKIAFCIYSSLLKNDSKSRGASCSWKNPEYFSYIHSPKRLQQWCDVTPRAYKVVDPMVENEALISLTRADNYWFICISPYICMICLLSWNKHAKCFASCSRSLGVFKAHYGPIAGYAHVNEVIGDRPVNSKVFESLMLLSFWKNG